MNTRRWICTIVLLCPLTGCSRPAAPATDRIQSSDQSADLAAMSLQPAEGSFVAWRNLDHDGVEPPRDVLTQWSADSGVVWEASVPGTGHSSPIVCENRVFLTTADEAKKQVLLLAYDKATGNQLWDATIHSGPLPRMHKKNSHASATPACDGEHVFVAAIHDDGLHVTACDMNGNTLWQRKVGPFQSEHGYGSSIVLWHGLLFVSGDSPGNGYLAALVRDTGEIAWRTPREGAGIHGSYSTPLVKQIAGKDQLVHSGYGRIVSYDPTTGDEIWRCDGPSEVTANTVVADDRHVYVSGGYPEKQVLCIRADGTGDVTDSHIQWSVDHSVTYVPSPTLVGDKLVTVTDDGILAVFDKTNGNRSIHERLGGNFYASPLVIGDTFYVPNESGEVFVFRIDPQYELIAKNRLSDAGGMASIAVSGNQLFVRTAGRLYCLQ